MHGRLAIDRRGRRQMTTFGHIARLIERLPLFQGLEAGLVLKIAGEARMIRARKREVIFRKGERSDGFYVVSYGRIRLSLFSNKGTERPIHIAGAGTSFGEAAMLQDLAHNTTAIAAEDSGLVFVRKDTMVELFQSEWKLGMRMMANLAGRLRLMVNDVDEFTLQPPAARLVNYLLRLVPPGGMDAGGVRLSLQKNLMAAQLNLKPETLSRYFRQFRGAGLIRLEGGFVMIPSIEKLSQYASAQH